LAGAALLAVQERRIDQSVRLPAVVDLDDDTVERTSREVDDHDVGAPVGTPQLSTLADPPGPTRRRLGYQEPTGLEAIASARDITLEPTIRSKGTWRPRRQAAARSSPVTAPSTRSASPRA
jgi:hypothetical protein